MKCITVEYYHARIPYLPSEAIEKIIQSRETIKNTCKKIVDKYNTSTRRIYEIWKRYAQGLPQHKQQIIQNTFSSEIASMPKNNISNEWTKKKRSSSKSIYFSHLSSNSEEKIRKISENIMNDDIPNTDIVTQIE
ncbi:10880_t:CDS:1 [Scutellospora calospora]|uniref:10880_t:CDS:1 n=1 Tax=Scutellospora calospora TaxID=85575 RepID=A0ACA9LFU7_9GLOM|nr:10880_t:CDS:1 [Scutellospora calospora]